MCGLLVIILKVDPVFLIIACELIYLNLTCLSLIIIKINFRSIVDNLNHNLNLIINHPFLLLSSNRIF